MFFFFSPFPSSSGPMWTHCTTRSSALPLRCVRGETWNRSFPLPLPSLLPPPPRSESGALIEARARCFREDLRKKNLVVFFFFPPLPLLFDLRAALNDNARDAKPVFMRLEAQRFLRGDAALSVDAYDGESASRAKTFFFFFPSSFEKRRVNVLKDDGQLFFFFFFSSSSFFFFARPEGRCCR